MSDVLESGLSFQLIVTDADGGVEFCGQSYDFKGEYLIGDGGKIILACSMATGL